MLDKSGFKVPQLYIAQVKRKHGIIERENYNTCDGKAKVPQVPANKEKAIEDALRHFQHQNQASKVIISTPSEQD